MPTSYIAAIFWISFIPTLSARFGRKKTHILVNISSLIYFMAYFFSSTLKDYLISQLFSGGIFACQLTVTIISITEYSSPQYRGLFVTIKSASFAWGVWVANAVGTYFHWKNIGLVGIVCSIYVLVTNLFWPESPSWLAGKGRFDECSGAHRWLKGTDDISERELASLIDTQMKYINDQSRRNTKTLLGSVRDYFNTIRRKEYIGAMLLTFAMLSLYPFTGKIVSTVYAIDIMKKITNDEATAYNYMLTLDGFTVFSMYTGCILSKFIRRRTMLFSFTSAGIIFLFSLALYLCLVRYSIILETKQVSLALLIGYSVTIGCGPMILTTSINAEIAPLRYRGIFFALSSMYFCLVSLVMLKVSPLLFTNIGLDGTFFLFAILSTCFTCVLYKYLPETKDQNFKEIEESLKLISSEPAVMYTKNKISS